MVVRYDQPYIQDVDGIIVTKLIPEFQAGYEGLTEDKWLHWLVKLGILKREYKYYDRWDRLKHYRNTVPMFDCESIYKSLINPKMQEDNDATRYFKYRVDRMMNVGNTPIGICKYKFRHFEVFSRLFCYPFIID